MWSLKGTKQSFAKACFFSKQQKEGLENLRTFNFRTSVILRSSEQSTERMALAAAKQIRVRFVAWDYFSAA